MPPYWPLPVCEAPRRPGNSPPDHSEAKGERAIGIGRSIGTAVVTLVGPVDTPGATRLAATLSDLIDGQGNLAIAMDLTDARRVEPSLQVLSDAAFDLERRGGRLSLCEARQGVLDASISSGSADSSGSRSSRRRSAVAGRVMATTLLSGVGVVETWLVARFAFGVDIVIHHPATLVATLVVRSAALHRGSPSGE